MKAILGEKLGMTQVFDDEARAIPVTVLKAGPCHVAQIKTTESDGYGAIQIAFQEIPARKSNGPMTGHYSKAGIAPHRHLVELRVDDPGQYTLGQEISVGNGTGPLIFAWVRTTVSAIFRADSSTTSWS